MHEETTLLVNAIDGLRQEPNYFKDYAFPIASAFFTSILGAGIAYLTLRHQEGIQIEKDKMDAANKWILSAEEARATLLAIKGNYHGELSENPLQRLAAIPSILFHASPIAEGYQDLSFVVPNSEEDGERYHKWSQIPRIRSMVSNYNYILKLWEQRNGINQEFKEQLLKHYVDKAYATLSLYDTVAALGQAKVVILMDLTERLIKLTDDLIVEFDNFLSEFPAYAKTKIQVKRLKRYGSIMTYSNNGNQKLLDLLVKSPEVDFKPFEPLFGESSESIKNRHLNGYEE
ncbi:hypothetical protein ACRN93_15480 [Shewanella baltica]|uniref:hypothetical protein n=1 Tax=Shewanella baltica TaxID=62322 RepID=UPI003D0838E8